LKPDQKLQENSFKEEEVPLVIEKLSYQQTDYI